MGKLSTSLVYCLLVLFLDVVQMENNLATKATESTSLTLKQGSTISTLTNSVNPVTTSTKFAEGTAQYSSVTTINENFPSTAATTENTSQFQTSPSTLSSLTDRSTLTSLTDSASLKSTTQSTETPTFTTTHTNYTTPDMSVSPSKNSSLTTEDTANRTTQGEHRGPYSISKSFSTLCFCLSMNLTLCNLVLLGLNLNDSEKIMTIIFSVVLGVFLLALVMTLLCKCRYKLQYLHQPLNSTNEAGKTFFFW